ncbi:hypothetical protein HY488_01115 [Candidatus Woesearchaeota archaeon]|nr:hypothetical protein [Candidatus Woesearchaeota archaeon]
MAEAVQASLVFFPAISLGIIIGILELIFVHSDEPGMGWFKHGLHAIPTMLVLLFVSFNIGPVSQMVGYPLEESFALNLGVRILLGIIATVKVKAAAAIAGKASSFGEKFWHAAVIGLLIAAAPYIWVFVEPLLPEFLKF